MDVFNPTLDSSWKEHLQEELSSSYYKELCAFLANEESNSTIYPPYYEIFTAFNLTPYDKVKVVVLGQDPYHNDNQAHGLAFSVKKGVPPPPSLINIFKELEDDLGIKAPKEGDLTLWAEEGVFLLNTVLTVRAHEANSHKKKGWEKFTDAIIKKLSSQKDHLVFILWGNPAQRKKILIDSSKHLILEAPHPSPLSSYRGFFGSKPFSKTNNYLAAHNITPINWELNR